jgi:hypothetical protein
MQPSRYAVIHGGALPDAWASASVSAARGCVGRDSKIAPASLISDGSAMTRATIAGEVSFASSAGTVEELSCIGSQ